MQRFALTICGATWLACLFACTGAGGLWFEIPGGLELHRSDHWDFYLEGDHQLGGHIQKIAYNDRFVLVQRTDCQPIQYKNWQGRWKRSFQLVGEPEYFVIDLESGCRYGPMSEQEFQEARIRLDVPESLELADPDEVRTRLNWANRDPNEGSDFLLSIMLALFIVVTGRWVYRRLTRNHMIGKGRTTPL